MSRDRHSGDLGAASPSGRSRSELPPAIGPGVVLDDAYELEARLGEGAMGVVYQAIDRRLDRRVAIKFIQPFLVRKQESHDRFLREARLMARVHHVNVVEIYAYGEYAEAPYFVMEYVEGTTVDDWVGLRADPVLSIDEAVGILDQTCLGVEAIHAAGAVHRDLKPTNVMIGTAFRVCVTDLGLARKLDRVYATDDEDSVSGTPAYIAPELVLGSLLPPELESVADVYSLGVMAFELMTGRLPFEYLDPSRMMIAHADEYPPIPSELRHDLPGAFDGAILNALIKDPSRRTPTAGAFRRELLEAREQANAPSAAVRLLVADDDDDFRALVEETLRYAFPAADIVSVPDGTQALRAMEREPAQLAIVDLDMPGLNGVELTAAFRATPALASMPIMVVTATGGAPDWRLLSSLGADGFLVKPIDPISLVALARRTISEPAP